MSLAASRKRRLIRVRSSVIEPRVALVGAVLAIVALLTLAISEGAPSAAQARVPAVSTHTVVAAPVALCCVVTFDSYSSNGTESRPCAGTKIQSVAPGPGAMTVSVTITHAGGGRVSNSYTFPVPSGRFGYAEYLNNARPIKWSSTAANSLCSTTPSGEIAIPANGVQGWHSWTSVS
jgi:hypothetical protein